MVFGVFWYISPILKPLPLTTGSYSIGTQEFHFFDQQRDELFSSDTEKRSVMVRMWYPSSVQTGRKYQYLGNKMPLFQKMFADEYYIPHWLSALLWRSIATHAYINASLASVYSMYPIILFSHGLLGLPSETYSALIQNLASHGYIVVSIDHPYLNFLTQYPNGKVVSSHYLSTQFSKMRPHEQYEFQSQAINIYKADMKFAIDQLERINQDAKSIFYNRLDLNNIGVMGHSAGGTAAIEFCRIDDRCKAAVDLDGWYDHIIAHEPLKKPLLLIFGSKSIEISEPTPEYLKRKELSREQYFEREQKIADHRKELCSISSASMVVIPGLGHDFGDGLLLKWPLREWNDVDGYTSLKRINSHLLQFFDQYLR